MVILAINFLPVPSSLFPLPCSQIRCSLFPKTHNFVPHECYNSYIIPTRLLRDLRWH
ncbi:MAG: hypothetical protein F6K55_04520 [Moorea sp. SIO4A3]|nr:hypothetical protein [Moorena sp. SIO4A3]